MINLLISDWQRTHIIQPIQPKLMITIYQKLIIQKRQLMLRHIAYRNAYYHGEVRNLKSHGVGCLVDNGYGFVLGQWREGILEGNVFVIMENQKVFCGRVEGGKLGFGCLYVGEGTRLFVGYGSSDKVLAVIEKQQLVLQINTKSEPPKVTNHKATTAAHLQESVSQLLSLSQQQIAIYNNWHKYLRQTFVAKHRQMVEQFRHVVQGKAQFCVCMKNYGLGIRAEIQEANGKASGQHLVVRFVGQVQGQAKREGIGKKVTQTLEGAVREESVYGQKDSKISYNTIQQRPKQAIRLFNAYLKRSLSFCDKFMVAIDMNQLVAISGMLDVEMVEETYKIAQIILHRQSNQRVVLAEKQESKETINNSQSMLMHNSQLTHKSQESLPKLPEPLLSNLPNTNNNRTIIINNNHNNTTKAKISQNNIPKTQLKKAHQSIYSSITKRNHSKSPKVTPLSSYERSRWEDHRTEENRVQSKKKNYTDHKDQYQYQHKSKFNARNPTKYHFNDTKVSEFKVDNKPTSKYEYLYYRGDRQKEYERYLTKPPHNINTILNQSRPYSRSPLHNSRSPLHNSRSPMNSSNTKPQLQSITSFKQVGHKDIQSRVVEQPNSPTFSQLSRKTPRTPGKILIRNTANNF